MRWLSVSIIFIALAGCQLGTRSVTSTNTEVDTLTYWLNYSPTQCNANPWGATLDEQVIADYYENKYAVVVYAVEVTPEPAGFFTCAACGCATGETVSLQTDAAGRIILQQHGFSEEVEGNNNVETITVENTNTEEFSATEQVEVEISAEDIALESRATQLQAALANYYAQHGSYPDTVAALELTIDYTGLTYTPIGVTPADYYDLSLDYSTGREILNP